MAIPADKRIGVFFFVLTDGIEDSIRANFNTADIGPKAIARIINREKAEHRLPDLGQVDVWMAK